MDSSKSCLSLPKYGCDFVVATTQASINSNMLQYFAEGTQPVEYICYLADTKTGNPGEQIRIDDLLAKTNGVHPFYIPDDTPWADERVQALYRAGFMVGIKLQMGLPPGVMPKDLPPIVTFDDTIKSVLFNLLCSQLTIVQVNPPAWGAGSWNVWSQPYGTAWTVQTRVNLLVADLDAKLNTPYFDNHPEVRDRLQKALKNLSGTAFSLQQLLFDLDNTLLESLPRFSGVPDGSNAQLILQKVFVGKYWESAKSHGLPLVSVMTVSQPRDKSSLHLTGFERMLSPLQDGQGKPIKNPTPL